MSVDYARINTLGDWRHGSGNIAENSDAINRKRGSAYQGSDQRRSVYRPYDPDTAGTGLDGL